MPYVIRPDLVEQDLLIPAINTTQFYDVDDVAKLKHIGSVNEDFEDDESGGYVKFYAPEGHVVYLYNIDLEYREDK